MPSDFFCILKESTVCVTARRAQQRVESFEYLKPMHRQSIMHIYYITFRVPLIQRFQFLNGKKLWFAKSWTLFAWIVLIKIYNTVYNAEYVYFSKYCKYCFKHFSCCFSKKIMIQIAIRKKRSGLRSTTQHPHQHLLQSLLFCHADLMT